MSIQAVMIGVGELAGALHVLADGQAATNNVDMASLLRLLARHAEALTEGLEQLNANHGGTDNGNKAQ